MKYNSLHFLVLIVITVTLSFTANADTASHKKRLEEMLNLLRIEKQINESVKSVQDVYANRMQALRLPDEYKSILNDHQDRVFSLISSAINWDRQKDLYVQTYSTSLTELETRNVVRFLRSKAGRSFIASQQQVHIAIIDFNASQMAVLRDQLTALGNEFQNQISQIQKLQ